MRIAKVGIHNYRNLDKMKMHFDPDMNFLIGENDLGKSNLLDMFDVIFNYRGFSEDDFYDNSTSIRIELSLLLNEIEKGVFADYFDPTNNNLINIVAQQEPLDEQLRYFHMESEEEIHYSRLRCANFLKYDSLRTPKEELTFYRNRGVGKFLSYLINRFVAKDATEQDYIKKGSVDPIVERINEVFAKMRLIKDFMISASIEKELTDLVHRMLTIKDSKGIEIQKTGHGVQFSVLIILYILERLMQVVEDRRRQESVFAADEKKTISLILGVDEPEIHLHPYMQRSLMNFVNSLLQNKEEDFSSLVKELFDVDGFDGQAIIVSHSPSILLDNYKYIDRFYREGSKIKVRSGSKLALTRKTEKHLSKNLPYIKEAFFSRCVIIVEGDTEYGALPIWAAKMGDGLDELGITVIRAGGASSIPPITDLLSEFRLPSVSIVDRDAYEHSSGVFDSISRLNVTDRKDFEEELVESLFASGQAGVLFELIKDYDTIGLERTIQRDKLKETAGKYKIGVTWDDKDHTFNEIRGFSGQEDLKKAMFLSWLDINKSMILGRYVGERVKPDYVPEKYKRTIEQAEALSQGHGSSS